MASVFEQTDIAAISGQPTSGMSIESVLRRGGYIIVSTTGCHIMLSVDGIDVASRITGSSSTFTNGILRYGGLAFSAPLAKGWTVTSSTSQKVVCTSNQITFTVYMDGVCYLANAGTDITYTWTDGVTGATRWTATGSGAAPSHGRTLNALSRVDCNYDGGAWHVPAESAEGSLDASDVGEVTTTLSAGDEHMFAAFPCKQFPYARWLDRPHLAWLYTLTRSSDWLPYLSTSNLANWYTAGIGIIGLWNNLYDGTPTYRPSAKRDGSGDLWYYFFQPADIMTGVSNIHAAGMKAICYFYGEDNANSWFNLGGTIANALDWLTEIRDTYGFDGVYFDGMGTGPKRAHELMRRTRRVFGEDGIIVGHTSTDVSGNSDDGVKLPNIYSHLFSIIRLEFGDVSIVYGPDDDNVNLYARTFGHENCLYRTLKASSVPGREETVMTSMEHSQLAHYHLGHGWYSANQASGWLNHTVVWKPHYDALVATYSVESPNTVGQTPYSSWYVALATTVIAADVDHFDYSIGPLGETCTGWIRYCTNSASPDFYTAYHAVSNPDGYQQVTLTSDTSWSGSIGSGIAPETEYLFAVRLFTNEASPYIVGQKTYGVYTTKTTPPA